MDKEDDVDSKKESIISRFTLDGVVVDEVIEVDEDNEHLSHKTLKINDLEDCKDLKTYSSESDDSPIKKSSFDKCLQQKANVVLEQTERKSEDDYSPGKENYLSVNDGENSATEKKISSQKETETDDLKENKELNSVSNNEMEAKQSQDERNSLTHKELELDHYSSEVTEVDENGKKKSKSGLNKNLNSLPSQKEIEVDEPQDHESGLDKLHGKEKELRSRKRKTETVTPKIKVEVDEKDDVQDVQVYYPTRKRRKTGNTAEDTEVQIKTEIVKTPDSKRKAAFEPLDVKPSIYQMLCAKRRVVKLGDIPSVAERIKRTKVDLVHLYRSLFLRSPKEHIMKGSILNFKGFPFDKNSSQFLKRKQMLESLEFYRVLAICNVLGFCKESKKSAMVSKILEFLLKPYDIMGVEKDPSMQPYVKLERLSLDKYVLSSDEEKADSGRSLRKRRASAANVSETVKSPAVKVKNVTLTRTKTPLRSVKIKQFGSKKKSKPMRPTVSSESAKSPVKSEAVKSSIKSESLKSAVKSESKSATKHGSQKPGTSKSQKPNITPDLEKISNVSEPTPVVSDVETEAKGSIVEKDVAENTVSNEVSQENIEDGKSKAAKKTSPVKKIVHTRKGRPLRVFPKINQSIKNANFSALQRLHILLFGASDKAENLKGNILAFGGFPFLEGSEEWKQKQFLLSLLAQNTLREYLNLLCIEYGDDDQPTMINKLMKFLAAPNETTQAEATDIETKAVSPELTNKKSVQQPVKVEPSKKKGKKVKKKSESRPRKVLMSDVEVRRLEAEIARAQRILDREKKINEAQMKMLPVKTSAPQVAVNIKSKALPIKTESLITKQADVDQINALLQTVYKRRALKAAGAVISTPNKGTKTKLGDLANVKFLVVTANYNDLSVLHHLIFMAEANKAKIRKNILDFDGFGFNEDSKKYKQRMDFLNRLGYDISKRIAFLLGLCPFQTDIPQQDLNELIMYFLMSPCITKQVPITQLPQTFFRQELPKELSSILQNNEEESVSKSVMVMKSPSPSSKEETSTVGLNMSGPSSGQKAKKSLRPSAATLPPMKKTVLSTTGSPQNITQRSLIKSPTSNTTPTIQQQFSKSLLTIANSTNTQPSVSPSLANRKILIKSPPVISSPQEYFIQQQTPDGQQKTFKVIRFAQPPPVTSVFSARAPQAPIRIQAPTTPVNMAISGASLPPGIILLKNKPSLIAQPVPNLLQSVPFVINQQANRITGSVAVSNSINVVPPSNEEYVLPDEVNAKSSAINWNEEDVEVLHPLEDNPPTDEELYASIQEIIHSSNFEDITLRNVIDRVSAQYSNHDLTHRHNYMKECVKKIIIGT